MVKRILVALSLIIIAFIINLVWKAYKSHSMSVGPYENWKRDFKACPETPPNCAYTEIETSDPDKLREKLSDYLLQNGYSQEYSDPELSHFTYQSRIFKFVDDLLILIKPKKILLRSFSRVGYSDLGVNKKRIADLLKVLEQ